MGAMALVDAYADAKRTARHTNRPSNISAGPDSNTDISQDGLLRLTVYAASGQTHNGDQEKRTFHDNISFQRDTCARTWLGAVPP